MHALGKSNRFHYSYRTSAGTKYWLVDADKRTKVPLFDHSKVAGAISQTADAIYEHRFDDAERDAAKRLFLRLVAPGRAPSIRPRALPPTPRRGPAAGRPPG